MSAPEAESDPDVGQAGQSGLRVPAGPPLELGTVLGGRFRLDERLGAGGMAYVYGATDERLRRQVAVKVIRGELAADSGLTARFEREAYASSRLSHPNVVVVHDFGTTDDGLPYLVMERLHGRTLSKSIRTEGRLAPSRAVAIAMDIAKALVAAHEAEIVHRDLKPDNVFITEDGNAKVLDFGIAKILGNRAPKDLSLTQTGMLMGTPLYMSPEAIKKKGQVGTPADLYSLGTIVYRMLTGKPPYRHEEPVVVLTMHLRDPVPPLADAAPDAAFDPVLDAFVQELMAKKPARRPSAAVALVRLEAIARHLEDAPHTVADIAIPESRGDGLDGATVATPVASMEATEVTPLAEATLDLGLPPEAAAPPPVMAEPTPATPRGFPTALVAVAVAVLALVMGGVAGWLALRGEDETTATATASPSAGEVTTPVDEPAIAPSPAPVEPEEPVAEEPLPIAAPADAPTPEAEEPAAATTARLELRTDVPAALFVDGERMGSTPASLDLEPGAHRLELRANGVRRQVRVQLEAGRTLRRRVNLRRRARPQPSGSGLDLPDQW